MTVAQAQEPAPATPGRASLSWSRGAGAEECISAERLQKALEKQLGYAAFEDQAELLVQGIVVREEAPVHFLAQVELQDRTGNILGRREVKTPGKSCGALDEALVLVLALAIDTQLAVLAAEATARPSAPVIEPTPSESSDPSLSLRCRHRRTQ